MATSDFAAGEESIAYYEGWAEVNRDLLCGSYADGYLLRRLKQLGLIQVGWQTMSTAFPESTPVNRKYVDILQRFPTRDMPPHPRDTWDENVIYVADWGPWWPPGQGPSHPAEEDNMLPVYRRVTDGFTAAVVDGQLLHLDSMAHAKELTGGRDPLPASADNPIWKLPVRQA
jgi:hypothetical protein